MFFIFSLEDKDNENWDFYIWSLFFDFFLLLFIGYDYKICVLCES